MEIELLPCPFCGGKAEVERLGTNRQSCIVHCTECGCTLESNETGAGWQWNMRVKQCEPNPSNAKEAIVETAQENNAPVSVTNEIAKTGEIVGPFSNFKALAEAIVNIIHQSKEIMECGHERYYLRQNGECNVCKPKPFFKVKEPNVFQANPDIVCDGLHSKYTCIADPCKVDPE